MARRRPLVVEVQPEPKLPEKVRRGVSVDEWVDLAEVADARAMLAGDTINGRPMADDVQQVSWELRGRARSRVRTARRQWAGENGLDSDQAHRLIIAGGFPGYLDESVFLAEIRRAISDS